MRYFAGDIYFVNLARLAPVLAYFQLKSCARDSWRAALSTHYYIRIVLYFVLIWYLVVVLLIYLEWCKISSHFCLLYQRKSRYLFFFVKHVFSYSMRGLLLNVRLYESFVINNATFLLNADIQRVWRRTLNSIVILYIQRWMYYNQSISDFQYDMRVYIFSIVQ